MIRRLVIPFAFLLGCILSISSLYAQPSRSVLISTEAAQQNGLERAWFTQIRVNPARGMITDVRLHISGVRSKTVYEVVTDGGRKDFISERHLNTFGEPYGVEGAAKAAAERMRVLRIQGIEATMEEQVIPEITLYATTNCGMVHAVDGETGRTLWTTAVGRQEWPTTPAAVSEDYVAVSNGTTLFVLDARNGQITWERPIGGAPSTGAAIVDTNVFVPLLNGQLHAFSVAEDARWWAKAYRSHGTVRFQPTVAGNYVVWPNDFGEISAIQSEKQGVKYRISLSEPIASPVMYSAPNQLLCVTRSGYLYSLNANDGSVQWRFSTGEETGEAAAIVGGTVYVLSRWAGIQAISSTTGQRKWAARGARQFVAATGKNVYTTNRSGQMIILDAQTGNVRGHLPIEITDQLFVNNQTDRIYIGGRSGVLQCLRELGTDWPTIHIAGEEVVVPPKAAPKKPASGGEGGPIDPFAGEDEAKKPDTNPFGTPAKTAPAKSSDNPFD